MREKGKGMFWVVLSVLLLLSTNGFTQYFDLGQDPASLKWRQIDTRNFKVIFPDYYEAKAHYFAAGLEQAASSGTRTLTSRPRKLPVIFHTTSVNSNAMVPWAPRRMEIYTPPPQDNYSQPWLDQLILHEYRHVQQIEKMNQGFTGGLYYLFGEQAAAAMIGLFVPFWFLEGDAVATETGWSLSGRGREPSFTMPLRGQLASHGIYSYDKAVYGSYRDFVPNHYMLGYYLVGASRIRYGPGLWEDAVNTAARKPFLLVPWNYSLKKKSSLTKSQLYHSVLSDLDSCWKVNVEMTMNDHESQLMTTSTTNRSTTYVNYRHPSEVIGRGILAEKSSIDDVNRYVMIGRDGEEKVLHTPGFNFSQTLSASHHLVTWSVMRSDPRWNNRSYADVQVYDIETGKVRMLTRHQRIVAPCLSPDAKSIAAVELDSLDDSRLVILDAETGEIRQRIRAPEGISLMTPAWMENQKKIVAVGVCNKGKALITCDLFSETWSVITPWSYTELYLPRAAGNYIYFTGGYSGVDQVYAMDTSSQTIYQVTSVSLGATDAFVTDDCRFLYYASYTGDGYRIERQSLAPGQWEPMEGQRSILASLADSLTAMENYLFDGTAPADSHYTSRPYRDWKNLFNIHSWGPFYVDADNQDFYPGASIMSQNRLSTAFTTLGYRYDMNEREGTWFADFSYRGLYPVADITYKIGERKSYFYDSLNNKVEYSWREDNLRTMLRIPLLYLVSRWIVGWQPSVGATFMHINHPENTPSRFITGTFQVMEYRLLAYGQMETSYRDLYPRWGMTLDLNFRHTPYSGTSLGEIGSAAGCFYLPGFVRHHGFRLYAACQRKDPGKYRFADLINYPRGYSGIYMDDAFSFSAGYKFPFWYPDLALGPVIYLKRLKASVFWDYATGKNRDSKNQLHKESYQSLGLDLTADMHVLRFLAPFDLGLRTIYLPDESEFRFQFLFSMDVNSFY